MKKNQIGIGFVELMLVLAIIGIVLLMSVKYFTVGSLSHQVNIASRDLDSIASATSAWWDDNNHTFTGISISGLVDNGYLSSQYETTPWGTQVQVGVYKTTLAKITYTLISPKACYALTTELNLNPSTTGCTVGGPNNTVNFYTCVDSSKNYQACQ